MKPRKEAKEVVPCTKRPSKQEPTGRSFSCCPISLLMEGSFLKQYLQRSVGPSSTLQSEERSESDKSIKSNIHPPTTTTTPSNPSSTTTSSITNFLTRRRNTTTSYIPSEWRDFFSDPSSSISGTAFAVFALLSFLSYEEVERYCIYTGPHGLRNHIFPPERRRRQSTTTSSSPPSVLSSLYNYTSNWTRTISDHIHNDHDGMTQPTTVPSSPVALRQAHSVMSPKKSSSSVGSSGMSTSSDGSHPERKKKPHRRKNSKSEGGDLPPPVLVYHESARSIVFRDHLRRAAEAEDKQRLQAAAEEEDDGDDDSAIGPSTHRKVSEREIEISRGLESEWNEMSNLFGGMDSTPAMGTQSAHSGHQRSDSHLTVEISGFQPNIVPLPHLQLGSNDEFEPLLASDTAHPTFSAWTDAEKEVVHLLETQRAVVKTIKNSEWTSFLHRFQTPHPPRGRCPDDHNDIPPTDQEFPFNSFVTSTTLLPAGGRKMRCYGNPNNYTTGVIFALPEYASTQDETKAVEATRTWSWPSGYSAKTEFNIDSRGELINGRQEALVTLSTLREYNQDYLTKDEYMIAGRLLKGGLNTVPYNEVFVRVGGPGRLSNGKDCATGLPRNDLQGTGRSLDKGVGLPVALFVRTATFGHLISLLRTRARLQHVLGERHIHGIPLLYMTPDKGIRVLTKSLEHELLRIASKNLNPFQNPMIAHKTTIDDTDQAFLETKVEELIDLDETIRQTLTPEECVRLAGGFGATDDSIAQILKDAMYQDKHETQVKGEESHRLQDIVNEGLASAVRSGDYYTSRQLLILYSLVASEGHQMDLEQKVVEEITDEKGNNKKLLIRKKSLDSEAMLLKRQAGQDGVVTNANSRLPPPPPPPPLDTDRLRSATNSDGLLAVLGAAQVLKAMQDGSAKKRTEESFLAVEEWVEYGEQSMAFRLASWRDQRAAQDDLQIAFDNNSSFMAFVSKKAITNRTNFAKQLREATKQTDFSDVRFLRAIYEMVQRMHSPCLRLELLQYVLGLDNRYSIAHVKRSIELAATCLSIAAVSEEPSS